MPIITYGSEKDFTLNRSLPCNTLQEVLKIIVKYEEKMFWQATNPEKLVTVLFLNLDTTTWSLVLTDGKAACLIDAGKGFEFVDTYKNQLTPQNRPQKQKGSIKNTLLL